MTREEALTEIKERVHVAEYVNSSYVDCVDIEAPRMAIKALEQPERKTGKWIKVMEGNAYRDKCSQCSDVYPNAHGYNYCPNCGSMMTRGEHDESD